MTVSSPKASAIGPNLLVHAYVDGELDAASALDLKKQIDADPAMAAEAANISALQGVLRSKLTPEQVPPGLRSQIRRAVGLSRWRDRPTWGALAASIITAVLVSSSSTWLVLHNPAALIVDEIVDNHLGALMASRPTDVSSSDRHTVKPWFSGKLSYAPKVVDLSPAGFPLVGARNRRREENADSDACLSAASPRHKPVRGSKCRCSGSLGIPELQRIQY